MRVAMHDCIENTSIGNHLKFSCQILSEETLKRTNDGRVTGNLSAHVRCTDLRILRNFEE